MASERNPAADADEDIVEKKPSHPVTTTLLIVSTFALLVAIVLASKELGSYVNPKTRGMTNGFKKTAVQLYEDEYGSGDTAAAPERPARGKAPAAAPASDDGGGN